MPRNSDNRRRIFADVVTVDAWHAPFADGVCRVDLHADVVFGTARVGGEAESPVRFRLSMKKAELVVVIPELEPVSVDPSSVCRVAPAMEAVLTETVENSTAGSALAQAGMHFSSAGLAASGGAELKGSTTALSTRRMESKEAVDSFIVTQSKTADGDYRWCIEPRILPVLLGRPWDPAKQPRLTLIDSRKGPLKGIPPAVRVEVRCRREDLHIKDIEVKDKRLWEDLKGRLGFRNRMAAAEAYIRDRLAEEGLEVVNITDRYGTLTLGSTTAQSI